MKWSAYYADKRHAAAIFLVDPFQRPVCPGCKGHHPKNRPLPIPDTRTIPGHLLARIKARVAAKESKVQPGFVEPGPGLINGKVASVLLSFVLHMRKHGYKVSADYILSLVPEATALVNARLT